MSESRAECEHVFGFILHEGQAAFGCLECGLLPHDPPLLWNDLADQANATAEVSEA